jgi:hypothetical protein
MERDWVFIPFKTTPVAFEICLAVICQVQPVLFASDSLTILRIGRGAENKSQL